VAWRNEERNGKPTKVPYAEVGREARSDDPSCWMPHDKAVALAQVVVNGGGGGVGIVLGRCNDLWLAGVDLDTCRDPVTGEVEPWALAVVQRLDSYTEISPSGTGVKVFFLIAQGDVETLREVMGTQHGRQFKRANGAVHPPAIELHISHRYFTVTWATYDDVPDDLRTMPLAILRWLVEEAGPGFVGKSTRGADILARLGKEAGRSRAVATALRNAATMKGGSRSEGAYGLGLALKRCGWSYEDMKAALQACTATREWAAEQDERQFQRVWQGDPLEEPPGETAEPPHILTGGEFTARHKPPAWLISGLVQRGRLYSCTSLTGHGKTAVWLFNACMVQAGRTIGQLPVSQGNVLILAGENPTDLEARMIGLASAHNLGSRLPYVLPGGFPMTADAAELLRAAITALGVPLSLIVGDTASSFFPGDDENSNVQAGGYARTLRTFNACPGNPAVVVLSHPVKNASRGNLLPRGGGAFLNELDGNLVLWSDSPGELTELHWCGKIRGPDFPPFGYLIRAVPTGMVDERGRPEMTVLAEPISDEAIADHAKQSLAVEDVVLLMLRDHPEWSMTQMAKDRGWLKNDGTPEKGKVQWIIRRLGEDKMISQSRKRAPWKLTDKGRTALKDAGK
jgi:hypothetical protein